MMKSLLLVLGLWLGSHALFAQEFVVEIPNQDAVDHSNPTGSFIVKNVQNNQKAIFIFYPKFYTGTLYDENWKKLHEIKAVDLPNRFSSIVGYTIENGVYHIIFNTSNGRNYGVTTFDFKEGSTKTFKTEFKLENESFIGSMQWNNTSFLLTASTSETQLNLYEFSGNFDVPKKSVLSFDEALLFSKKHQKSIPLFRLFSETASTIEVGLPVGMQTATSKVKIYQDTSKNRVLTSNTIEEYTYIFDIDLEQKEAKLTRFENPLSSTKDYYNQTNSFVLDKELYLFSVTSKNFIFQILSRDTQKTLFFRDIDKETEIDFSNTPIIQKEVGGLNNYRELKKTKQFIRKVSQSNLGVSAYKEDEKYIVTLGSSLQIKGSASPIFIAGGGFISGFISGAISGALSAYTSYVYTKSVSVNCLFDENFSAKEGTIPDTIFDKMREFEGPEANTQAPALAHFEEGIFLGSHDNEVDVYYLFKFPN